MKEEAVKAAKDLNTILARKGVSVDVRGYLLGACLCYCDELRDRYALNFDVNKLPDVWKDMQLGLIQSDILRALRNRLVMGWDLEGVERSIHERLFVDGTVRKLDAKDWVDILSYVWKEIYPYKSSGYDFLSLFYGVLNDCKESKNQVFTPAHIAEFICEVCGVNAVTKVLDPCCGSGSFLMSAISRMRESVTHFARGVLAHRIYGIESERTAFDLAALNMMRTCEGAMNIRHGSCFGYEDWIGEVDPDVILMNPPYNARVQDIPEEYRKGWPKGGKEEPTKGLVFVKWISDVIDRINTKKKEEGSSPKKVTLGVILPTSVAIGRGKVFLDMKQHLMDKNQLKAVFSLPDNLFYPSAGVNVCCMIWELGEPHYNEEHEGKEDTFFGYFKEDGYKVKKGLGRVYAKPAFHKAGWGDYRATWNDLWQGRIAKPGMSVLKSVNEFMEWLCEAYMQTDYSKLTAKDFEQTVRNYVAYRIKTGKI